MSMQALCRVIGEDGVGRAGTILRVVARRIDLGFDDRIYIRHVPKRWIYAVKLEGR